MTSLKITNPQEKVDLAKLEHEVLEFWDETKAFEKSVAMRPADKRYVFYDGPPFATGLPHYGHILASTIKDVIPRYFTMKGFRVDRVWGWDCHGIPIENMIEKELELKGGKKGIEELGVDKFNASCRAAILRFDKDWEKIVRRIGRWVDFKHSYKTMDMTYMESVWWAFKTLHDKGLIYEGRKVILYCPRCATPLSNFEIAMDNSYKDVEDHSVCVMFAAKGESNEYFVAWTTTPWTLIGNVGLAVDPKAMYVKVSVGDNTIWVAEKRVAAATQEENWEVKILEKVTGDKLVGREYEPLYSYLPIGKKKAYYVGSGDFVSLEEGTGIVHTAAVYGEDDYALAQKLDLPCVPMLDDQGRYLDFVEPLKGIFFKKAEEWIVQDLIDRDLLLRAEKSVHSYPFCYRCETPLYYNAIPAWFIDIQKLKPELLRANESINWYPEHLKHGRFGKGLETAPDWNISRSRYWGTPMPVWKCQMPNDKCQMRIIGSIEELKKWAVNPELVEGLSDIHREFLDTIEVWVDDEKTMKGKRIPEVFDCWVESGSMPFASIHAPFENNDLFKGTHPAQFISEYIAQTRAWFYTLHVMSVGLFGSHTFDNAVTTGTIMAGDGTKMSKSKKNFPDPAILLEKYGVDSLRFYLMRAVVMKGENINFSEDEVKDIFQQIINVLWNTFSFYKLYTTILPSESPPNPVHILDRWIVSKTNNLIKSVTESMDKYDTVASCRSIQDFVNLLSTWYLRRSRERFKGGQESMEVFGWVLKQLVLVMAPVTPFVTELMFQNLDGKGESVHLQPWPVFDEGHTDPALEEKMDYVRKIVSEGHSLRKESNIPVRQPLKECQIINAKFQIEEEYIGLIKEELNVKEVIVKTGEGELTVTLDMTSTPELEAEGKARELIRGIQRLRKEKGCTIDEHIRAQVPVAFQSLTPEVLTRVKKETVTDDIVWGNTYSVLTGST